MHHFVVFVYLPKRRFKTTISMKKGLNYLMPVPKENTIDKTWVHNRDVKTSNASRFVPYRKVLSYLKQRSMVLLCSCGANHFLLYYFVLTFEESCIRPLILPHFKQVECC